MTNYEPDPLMPHIEEAERLAWVTQQSINDASDNIDERELAIPIGLGILHATTEIARQLKRLADMAEEAQD